MRKLITMFICCALTVGCACSLASCTKDESDSGSSSSVKKDNSIPFDEIMENGLSSLDDSESFYLDGNFNNSLVAEVAAYTYEDWFSMGVSSQYNFAVNVLNMWMYYGDDTSIRYLPSELIDAISLDFSQNSADNPGRTVLEAINDYAEPLNADHYFSILNVEKSSGGNGEASDVSPEEPIEGTDTVLDE